MGKVSKAFCLLPFCFSLAWAAQPAAIQPPPSPAQEKIKAVMADPHALKAAIEAGRKASFFCANCHGEDGNSKTPDVPNLAGQNPAYLVDQIRKFAQGERKNPFMQGVIKVLKEEERMQVALFFANSTVVPGKGNASLAVQGKDTFERMCARCHGDRAQGNETIPRLAGQKMGYLKTTITHFRDKTGERNNPLMATATATLRDEEIAAIIHYLTQLH